MRSQATGPAGLGKLWLRNCFTTPRHEKRERICMFHPQQFCLQLYGCLKFQGLVGTRLASCSMAELVTEHAEIVAGLQRISRRQLLECRVALLYQNIGARPTSKGSSATAQPATQRLLSLKPKRRARPSHAPSSSFAAVSAVRSQARGAERIRDNRFPTRGPESISRSPLQRRRIHKRRKDRTRHRDNTAGQLTDQ